MAASKQFQAMQQVLAFALVGCAAGVGYAWYFAMPVANALFAMAYAAGLVLPGLPLLWMEWKAGKQGAKHGLTHWFFVFSLYGRSAWVFAGAAGMCVNLLVITWSCYLQSRALMLLYHFMGHRFGWMDSFSAASFLSVREFPPVSTTEAVGFFVLSVLLNALWLAAGAHQQRYLQRLIPAWILMLVFLVLNYSFGYFPGVLPEKLSLQYPAAWLELSGFLLLTLLMGTGVIFEFSALAHRPHPANSSIATRRRHLARVICLIVLLMPVAISVAGMKQSVFVTSGSSRLAVFWAVVIFVSGMAPCTLLGNPWFRQVNVLFKWSAFKSALLPMSLVLLAGLPGVLWPKFIFDEYLYWAVSVLLPLSVIAGLWFFVRKVGGGVQLWGYSCLLVLLTVFTGALIQPEGGQWENLLSGQWSPHPHSIIGHATDAGVATNRVAVGAFFESEVSGFVERIDHRDPQHKKIYISKLKKFYIDSTGQTLVWDSVPRKKVFDSLVAEKHYSFGENEELTIVAGSPVKVGSPLAQGKFVNKRWFLNIAKAVVMLLLIFCLWPVFIMIRREKNNRL